VIQVQWALEGSNPESKNLLDQALRAACADAYPGADIAYAIATGPYAEHVGDAIDNLANLLDSYGSGANLKQIDAACAHPEFIALIKNRKMLDVETAQNLLLRMLALKVMAPEGTKAGKAFGSAFDKVAKQANINVRNTERTLVSLAKQLEMVQNMDFSTPTLDVRQASPMVANALRRACSSLYPMKRWQVLMPQ
jgi:hypothetical protein